MALVSWYVMPHPPLAIPGVGRSEKCRIAATLEAYRAVGKDAASRRVETFLIISPHGPVFRDSLALFDVERLEGSMDRFGAPQERLSFPVNRRLTAAICESAKSFLRLDEAAAKRFNVPVELDHGAFVPLYYAAPSGEQAASIVHLTFGMMSLQALYELGRTLRAACDADPSRISCIASGDLSHRLTRDGPYPYSPRGAEFDRRVVDILRRGKFAEFLDIPSGLVEEAGQCGLRSFVLLAGMTAAETQPFPTSVLSYEGPFGVGYCVALGALETP